MIEDNGLLPPGRTRVTVEEFKTHFVDAFPESSTRGPLFERWLNYREVLSGLVPVKAQWIDGSFVTGKTDPRDIDLVNFFDGLELDATPSERRSIASLMLAGHATQSIWSIDAFVCAEYPEGHPNHDPALHMRGYWDWWLGRVRDDDTAQKGYLEVVV